MDKSEVESLEFLPMEKIKEMIARDRAQFVDGFPEAVERCCFSK